MTAGAWDAAVQADLKAIGARAMALYAVDGNDIPWPLASSPVRDAYRDRAERELWEEGRLLLDPSVPYYESTYETV